MRLALSFLALTACNPPCVDGTGDVLADSRTVDGFDQVSLETSGHLTLTQADDFAVNLRADRNLLDRLEVFVRRSTLVIRDTRGRCLDAKDELSYEVSMPALTRLDVSGDGEVIHAGPLITPELRIIVSGEGMVDAEVTSDRLTTEISGSGDVFLAGDTGDHDVEISGSGHVGAYGLTSETADVEISGSGVAYLTVIDRLEAEISGSGSVRYKGAPDVDADVSGSGSVRSAD